MLEKTEQYSNGLVDPGDPEGKTIAALPMFCSRQTLEGFRVTAISMLGVIPYLFKHNFKYVLTGHMNQDAIEVFNLYFKCYAAR